MSSRRRWLSRVLTAAVTAVLAAGAVPDAAAAEPDPLTVDEFGPVPLVLHAGGGEQVLTLKVRNTEATPNYMFLQVVQNNTDKGVRITAATATGGTMNCDHGDDYGQCEATSDVPGGAVVTMTMRFQSPPAGAVAAGEVVPRTGTLWLGGSRPRSTFAIQLVRDAPTVARVHGTVVDDQTQRPVPGAEVALTDAARRRHTARTGDTGGFSFAGSGTAPIAPGELTLAVARQGYAPVEQRLTGAAGGQLGELRLRLVPLPVPPDETSPGRPGPDQPGSTATDRPAGALRDGGGSSTARTVAGRVATGLGGLFVLAGLAGFVVAYRRRRIPSGKP